MLQLRAGTAQPFRTARPAAARVSVVRAVVPSCSQIISGVSLGERLQENILAGAASTCMKWTMMRHGNRVKHLDRPQDQRKALIRSLVTELLRHGEITTTKVKAKVIRKYVDHIITLAKRGDLHARRQALAFVYDPSIVSNLFTGVKDRFGDREGGYTRIKAKPILRRGDATEMATIELV